MYRNKKRENRYFSYIFNPPSTTQTLDGNDIEDFAGQDRVIKTPRAQASQLNYNSKEHIGAAYSMATFTLKHIGEAIIAVGDIHHFNGVQSTSDPL